MRAKRAVRSVGLGWVCALTAARALNPLKVVRAELNRSRRSGVRHGPESSAQGRPHRALVAFRSERLRFRPKRVPPQKTPAEGRERTRRGRSATAAGSHWNGRTDIGSSTSRMPERGSALGARAPKPCGDTASSAIGSLWAQSNRTGAGFLACRLARLSGRRAVLYFAVRAP